MYLSRRDDMQSLGYTFLELINPHCVNWSETNDRFEIRAKKIEFIEANNEDVPVKFRSIQLFLKKAYNMKFAEEPNYEEFRTFIEKMYLPYYDDLE